MNSYTQTRLLWIVTLMAGLSTAGAVGAGAVVVRQDADRALSLAKFDILQERDLRHAAQVAVLRMEITEGWEDHTEFIQAIKDLVEVSEFQGMVIIRVDNNMRDISTRIADLRQRLDALTGR